MEDSSAKPTTEEESRWTAYFDDFFAQQRVDEKSNTCISDHSSFSPSLVSDAASNVPWKKNHNHLMGVSLPVDCQSTVLINSKKLSFMKTRAKEIFHHDESLEDTASSPVNSPKISSLKRVDINPGKREDNEYSLGQGDALNITSGHQTNKKNQISNEENIDCEYSELKNKGLCLVPLSMLVNFIG